MERINLRIVFEVVPRLVALMILWNYVPSLLSTIYSLTTLSMSLGSIPTVLTIATSALAIATIITASPYLYSATVVCSLILSLGSTNAVSLAISILGLVALLALDTLRYLYRPGQRVKGLKLVSAVTPMVLISIAMALLCTLPSKYVAMLVQGIVMHASSAPSIVLKLLSENPVFVLIISVALTIALFLLVVNAFEIAALFALPSRELSIRALTSPTILTAQIDAPLRTIKTLVMAGLLAPPIYAALTQVVIPYLSMQVPYLYALASSRIGSIAIAVVVYIVSAILVRPIISGVEINPSRALVASLIVACLVYLSGFIATYASTGNALYSITHPSLGLVSSAMARMYLGFYAQFFYILEDLLRMLGVAP